MSTILLDSFARKPTSTLSEPSWLLPSNVPSGKLTVEQFNWNGVTQTQPITGIWTLVDHLPPGSTNWFARLDDLGSNTNPSAAPSAVGDINDLNNVYTRGDTFENNLSGYDRILIRTVIAPEIYGWWLYDKTQIARFQSENGRFFFWSNDPTHRPYIQQLDNYKRDNFAALGAVGGNSSNIGQGTYASDCYEHNLNGYQPLMFHKAWFNSVLFYQEGNQPLLDNSNASYAAVGGFQQLEYGMQIWLGKSSDMTAANSNVATLASPLMILHTGAMSPPTRDSLTTSITRSNKFQYIQLFVRESSAHSMRCLLYTSPSPRDRTRSRMPSSA